MARPAYHIKLSCFMIVILVAQEGRYSNHLEQLENRLPPKRNGLTRRAPDGKATITFLVPPTTSHIRVPRAGRRCLADTRRNSQFTRTDSTTKQMFE